MRQASGSDYAKCQGLDVYPSNKCSYWHLRSAGYLSDSTCSINYNGVAVFSHSANTADGGIRPSLKLNLTNNNEPEEPNGSAETAEIAIKNPPAKTEYIYKKDRLDLSGIELSVTYSDGTTETVTDTSKMSVSGFSNTVRGEQTVTVEYEGMQTSFKANVKYIWWQWILVIVLFGWIWY